MTGGPAAPVVVAVDDAATSDDAVEWAAAEAAARRCPLRLVHRPDPLPPVDPHGLAVWAPARVPCAGGEAVLLDALDRARRVAPDVPMSARPLDGPLVPALVAATGRAGLLVLGGRGGSRLRRVLTGSVSLRVAAGAACPVVVVRARAAAGHPPPAPPRVVLGVSATAGVAPAVGFAFRAARQRRIPLIALHAWTPDLPADLDGAPTCGADGEALARRALDRAVEPWCREYPDVVVRPQVVPGAAADVLVAGSRGAALLVVGSRGAALGALFGPVGRLAVRGGEVPLAIVGTGVARVPGRDDSPGRRDGTGGDAVAG